MGLRETSTPSRAREADLAGARAHLEQSFEHGREAAHDARRIARRRWLDLTRSAEDFVGSRPKTVAAWALGAGLAGGFLAGLLVSRAIRPSHAPARPTARAGTP